MIVNLTPLNEGDPDLYLNKGSRLPTNKEFDLSSSDVAGDFIQVDRRTFSKNETSIEGIEGYYIVGVYGNS